MRKTIIVCDKCGVEVENPFKLSMFKERRSNGVEIENWNWESDLCPRCLPLLVKKLMTIFQTHFTPEIKQHLATEFKCKEI